MRQHIYQQWICNTRKKFVTNAFKYGFKETTIEKWRAALELYKSFEEKLGMNVNLFVEQSVEKLMELK